MSSAADIHAYPAKNRLQLIENNSESLYTGFDLVCEICVASLGKLIT